LNAWSLAYTLVALSAIQLFASGRAANYNTAPCE
jgi:hypothetical protein